MPNGCPCGWLTDTKKRCRCHPHQIQKYMSKISGPLLDRIDIHLHVHSPKPHELLSAGTGESSAMIKARTTACRELQRERFAGTAIQSNAQMDHRKTKKHCPLDSACQELLREAIERMGLSARAHDKILKVARTVSDIEGSADILPQHLAEAISYRCLDRTFS